MKATTKIQATRIAEAGAHKMTADKYAIKPSTITALAATMFTVVNLETGKRYTVSIAEGKTFCSCPFYQENKEHGQCKHVSRCREEAADRARWEAEAAEVAEWEAFGRYL
jgi:predicted nucleic acid-binding Zn finger protein